MAAILLKNGIDSLGGSLDLATINPHRESDKNCTPSSLIRKKVVLKKVHNNGRFSQNSNYSCSSNKISTSCQEPLKQAKRNKGSELQL